MSFLADGSIHHRDRNLFWTPKGIVNPANSSITYVGGVNNINSNPGSVTVNLPGSSVDGDLIVVIAAAESGQTITSVPGYTFRSRFSLGTARTEIWTKVRQAGDPATTINVSGGVAVGFSFALRNQFNLSPAGAFAVLENQAAVNPVNFPDGTNITTNSVYVGVIRREVAVVSTLSPINLGIFSGVTTIREWITTAPIDDWFGVYLFNAPTLGVSASSGTLSTLDVYSSLGQFFR